MTVRTRTQLFLFAGVIVATAGLFATAGLIAAPQKVATDPKTAGMSETIPFDTAITTGTFSNGLRYYIRQNPTPNHRAALRLVVNAGSVLEDDDQRGLAHFVEHMAFNGTTHFPKMEIVNFMQSLGMRFGPHVNAYTSFDETVFELEVPTETSAVLDRSLLILEDWAHNVTFDDAEVDRERGVITEEWRLGLGADARMQQKQFPVLLKDSRYADRVPIGTMDVVQHVNHDRLKAFYADWYRPDLMAVVAVGDFDGAQMMKLVTDHFSGIPKPAVEKPRPSFTVPSQPGTRYTVATDKEATTANVAIMSLFPARDQATIGSYRQQVMENMFADMFSSRLNELAQQPDAPLLGGDASRGLFVRAEEASNVGALVKEDGIEKGLTALFTEMERVTRFGFTKTELDREKLKNLKDFENLVAEKGTHNSSEYAAEYTRNFTNGEPSPGIDYENVLYHRFVPAFTLDELNALARAWTPDKNRVIAVTAPDKVGLTVPTPVTLAKAIDSASVAAKSLKAYVDTTSSQPLLDPLPTPGAVVSSRTLEPVAVTEWTLSNGARVVLMPTQIKEDEILFRALSPGGTSIASDEDFVSAETAADVVQAGGLGSMSAIALRKALAGKSIDVQPAIDETNEGMTGSSTRADLETMFQLMYLSFTQPRADRTMFGVMTSQMKAMLANQSAEPEFAFNAALEAALTQNHPRARPLTADLVNQMNLDTSMAFYKARFADASTFTFVFVGSFDLATIKPLVERYVGSLPALHRNETWKDVGMRPPTGVVEKTVEKGLEPKGHAVIVFTGPFAFTQTNRIAARAMAHVMETRLRDTIRQDLGGTYNITVSPTFDKVPREEYEVAIEFGCNPSRTSELVKAVFAAIAKLQNDGPTAKEVSDVIQTFLRDAESNGSQNAYFADQLVTRYLNGEDIAPIFTIDRDYQRIDAAMIQQAAKQYLNVSNHVTVTLGPEKK